MALAEPSGAQGARCNECALSLDARRPAFACPRCETLVCRECLEFWHPDCQEARYA